MIDIRKGQEGDVAPLADVAVDLVTQLLLIVDRKDECRVETLFGSRDPGTCMLPNRNTLFIPGSRFTILCAGDDEDILFREIDNITRPLLAGDDETGCKGFGVLCHHPERGHGTHGPTGAIDPL